MQEFTIKDIENLTGIKAHTLRIWEQRYGLFIPKRKDSQHRIYDSEDLKLLLRISFLYHNGWKISKLAALSSEEINQTVNETEMNTTTYKSFVVQLIEAAIDFNEAAFVQLLENLFQKIGFENCIVQVCYPYLQRVGMLWVTNHIIPAQEHFSSYIIQNKIIAEIDKLPAKANVPTMILFSPKGEHHELPLLFIHYLLRKNGWSVIYLGANVTLDILKKFSQNEHLRYLFVHLITNFTGWDADIYFEDLCRTFQDKTIVVTGTVVHQIQRSFVNLKLLKKDKEIYDFIDKIDELVTD